MSIPDLVLKTIRSFADEQGKTPPPLTGSLALLESGRDPFASAEASEFPSTVIAFYEPLDV